MLGLQVRHIPFCVKIKAPSISRLDLFVFLSRVLGM